MCKLLWFFLPGERQAASGGVTGKEEMQFLKNIANVFFVFEDESLFKAG